MPAKVSLRLSSVSYSWREGLGLPLKFNSLCKRSTWNTVRIEVEVYGGIKLDDNMGCSTWNLRQQIGN